MGFLAPKVVWEALLQPLSGTATTRDQTGPGAFDFGWFGLGFHSGRPRRSTPGTWKPQWIALGESFAFCTGTSQNRDSLQKRVRRFGTHPNENLHKC